MPYENILVEKNGSLVRVTVNRPQAMNALNGQTMRELLDACLEIAESDALCVIVTGAGDKAFVAGADIKAMVELDPDAAESFSADGHRLGSAIAEAPQVWIAAVNGFALGGGCELALACDFAYASDKARFGQPEVNLGVIPGFGGTTRLARRVGVSRALELVTTGAIIGADEALRIGLCNRVVPAAELLAACETTAKLIATKGPAAVRAAKRCIRAADQMNLDDNNQLEIRSFGQLFAGHDQQEGMRAFLEKRAPAFTGR